MELSSSLATLLCRTISSSPHLLHFICDDIRLDESPNSSDGFVQILADSLPHNTFLRSLCLCLCDISSEVLSRLTSNYMQFNFSLIICTIEFVQAKGGQKKSIPEKSYELWMQNAIEDMRSLTRTNSSLWMLDKNESDRAILRARSLTSYCLQGISSTTYQRVCRLNLDQNNLTELSSSLGALKNLEVLSVNGNLLAKIDPVIGTLTALKSLSLKDNSINEIPPVISLLEQLRNLNLSGNQITTVPIYLGLLSSLSCLDLTKNPLEPSSIFSLSDLSNPMRAARHLAETASLNETFSVYVKVNFIGEVSSGKTTLISSLQICCAKGKFVKKGLKQLQPYHPTEGIEITPVPAVDNQGRRMMLYLYDYAGQSSYFATHQYFLSPNSLYVVVFSLAEIPIDSNHLRSWLTNISYSAPNSSVILVGTRRDSCPLSDDALQIYLEKEYADLAKFHSNIVRVEVVDCISGNGLKSLLDQIFLSTSCLKWSSRPIPARYQFCVNKLNAYRVTSNLPVITVPELSLFAKDSGLDNNEIHHFISFTTQTGVFLQVSIFNSFR
jgi:GTPase SAR1 family protein